MCSFPDKVYSAAAAGWLLLRERRCRGLTGKWRSVPPSCPTVWPPGRQPATLLCPRDFPGKHTGAGCRFLLQGIFLTQGSNLGLLHPGFQLHMGWVPQTPHCSRASYTGSLLLRSPQTSSQEAIIPLLKLLVLKEHKVFKEKLRFLKLRIDI